MTYRRPAGPCSRCGVRPHAPTSGYCSPCGWQYVRERNRALIDERLAQGCADCGETDPDVLEFDHVPERGPKLFSIANIKMYPMKALKAELAKCDVVCANDHRRRTRRRSEVSPVPEAAPPGV